MVGCEFQAVIFAAGKGSRMTELTAGTPKCLLPIGAKPLIWYPLHQLAKIKLTDIYIIVTEEDRAEIQAAVEAVGIDAKIEYCSIPSDEDFGTADSLRIISDKLTSDFICMSCDVVSEVDLSQALNMFRQHEASVVSVFFHPQALELQTLPGPKAKHKPEKDLIGIDECTNRLVFLASASDFEETVPLSMKLIRRHPAIAMHSSLVDAHIYIMKNWIAKYLKADRSFSTIKGELLPHIIRKQSSSSRAAEDTNASVVVNVAQKDIVHFAREAGESVETAVQQISAYNDHTGDMKAPYHNDTIRCYAHIASKKCFGMRVNTLPNYWTINQVIIDKWPSISPSKELALIDGKAEVKSNQVDDKCIVWESAFLDEKTSFKASILGSGTRVESRTRVFNSIVMNGAVIKQRCALENCLVCSGAVIECGSQLKNCLVGSKYVVAENSSNTHEVLTESDELMEF